MTKLDENLVKTDEIVQDILGKIDKTWTKIGPEDFTRKVGQNDT